MEMSRNAYILELFVLFVMIIPSPVFAAQVAQIVPAYSYMLSELAGSGFRGYVSLLLSDGVTLTVYWKEFGLTILESFPTVGVTLLCASILVALGMFRLAVKNFDAAIIHPQFA